MMNCVRILLSFAILACPFNCMGAFCGGDAQIAASPECSCCSHIAVEPANAPNQLPQSPGDDCPCCECFCHGAVLTSDSLSRDIADDELQPCCDLVAASLDVEFRSTTSSATLSAHAVPTIMLSGRFVRILHESFLL